MSKLKEENVHCLCGKIEIKVKHKSLNVCACHCGSCRKWGGGPFIEVNCGSDVSIVGKEHMKVFNSSDWAERGFCAVCGTHLFYRLKASQEHMVPIGLFQNTEGLVFDKQVFIDEKPGYYSFANETNNLTGEELFAQFAPPAE